MTSAGLMKVGECPTNWFSALSTFWQHLFDKEANEDLHKQTDY